MVFLESGRQGLCHAVDVEQDRRVRPVRRSGTRDNNTRSARPNGWSTRFDSRKQINTERRFGPSRRPGQTS